MDIETFVSETLRQIVSGVATAQKQIHAMDVGAQVNPTVVSSGTSRSTQPTPVEFDIAVTVTSDEQETTKAKAGASVGVLSVVSLKFGADVEGEGRAGSRNESISRVKFSVCLSQPGDIRAAAGVSIPSRASAY